MEDGGSKLLWNVNTTINNLHNVIYEKTSVSINKVVKTSNHTLIRLTLKVGSTWMKLCSKQRNIGPTSVMPIALYKVTENSLNSVYSTTLPRMSSNVQVSYLYCTTFTLLCTVSKTTDKCGARLDATISLNGSELLLVIFSELQLLFLTLQKTAVKAATCK